MSELTRLISLSKIHHLGAPILIRATPEECVAIAARMGIPAVESFECSFSLTPEGDGISMLAEGRLRAELTRVCVLSAEDFATSVTETFEIRFVPSGSQREDPDPDILDEIPYNGDTIDLGEAAVEQLGLAMDPYPRMEGAEMPEIENNDTGSPFSVLARRNSPDKTRH
jgi:uncharacterized metal-binding protein YceD (DUF177 family)